MCNKHNPRKIDKCLELPLVIWNWVIDKKKVKIVASCCGHGKYPMTIIVVKKDGVIFDLISGIKIPRKRRFYKKDKQGYYYIPETIKKVK